MRRKHPHHVIVHNVCEEHHQRNHRERSLSNGFARGARNADRALQLPDGNAPAEKFSDDSDGLLSALAGHNECVASAIREGNAAVRSRVNHGHAYLISGFTGFRDALLRLHVGMDQLALAFQVKLYRFSVRTANVFPELSPVLNSLPIHGTDNIAFLESGAIRWSSGSDFVEDRRERRIAEDVI